MQLSEFASLLAMQDNFLIITHRRPDGDTIGSAGALCLALRALGKTAWLYRNPEITDNYIGYVSEMLAPEGYRHETTVAVDVASEMLFPVGFGEEIDFCVDHHPSNTGYAKNALIWTDCAACGESAFELIKELGVTVTPEIAKLLYVAISTDTGCFCYGNTGSTTLRRAAELIDCGVENGPLNKRLFRTATKARLKLEGYIFSTLEAYHDGAVVIATVTLDMLEKSGATENDCEDLAALAGRLEGASVSVTITEKEPSLCKVSVRTGADVSANEICSRFGGGGHAMASGCTIHSSYEQAREQLIAVINEVMG